MPYCEPKKLEGQTRSEKWWAGVEKLKGSSKKWKTLQHNGPFFPESYEPLPKDITVTYKGEKIKLDSKNTNNPFKISAEEAAVFFAQILEQDERLKDQKKRQRYSDDEVFRKNFWADWKVILGSKSPIKSLDGVDFSKMVKYIAKRSEQKKQAKKEMTKEEKEKEKEKKQEIKDVYGYALVDGVKIEMDYNIEPPSLYRGHGKHPQRGKIKRRITPEDITINVSDKFKPQCYFEGKKCKWGSVVEDKTVTWLYGWKHPITNEMTYKSLNRTASHFVCGKDMNKFELASRLNKNIDKLRKRYKADLDSDDSTKSQLATAVYLLDILAIRPGTEKDETKEAGTLGLTTLKCENISFESDSTIIVDFTGKSSIQFNKKFKIDKKVYRNLKDLCKGKKKKDALFPKVNATSLNGYLKSIIPEVTAKVFRTWKASKIMQDELDKNIPNESDPVHVKQLLYNKVNLEVAKALNHKKMTDSDDKVEKIKQKIKELKKKKKEVNTDKQKQTVQKSIEIQESKLVEAEENIALGTSKLNYLDPRITVVWAKNGEVPIEKLYNKTQLKKFVWAMDADLDWKFG